VLTSIRAATRLVSVHLLLRFNITCTWFVSIVLHADGIPPVAFLAASDLVNKPHLHAPGPSFQLWSNLAEFRFEQKWFKIACACDGLVLISALHINFSLLSALHISYPTKI